MRNSVGAGRRRRFGTFVHNPAREFRREWDFLIFMTRNPLKRLDSEK
jgi:hypothetical protein